MQNLRGKLSTISDLSRSTCSGVGSFKRLGGGTHFPEMLAMGGGWIFSPYTMPKCTFLTTFYFKTSKLQNKKGTFDVNLVFTATLAFTKRALFITKNGTFSPLKYIWGHVPPVPPPPVPTPLSSCEKCNYMPSGRNRSCDYGEAL